MKEPKNRDHIIFKSTLLKIIWIFKISPERKIHFLTSFRIFQNNYMNNKSFVNEYSKLLF